MILNPVVTEEQHELSIKMLQSKSSELQSLWSTGLWSSCCIHVCYSIKLAICSVMCRATVLTEAYWQDVVVRRSVITELPSSRGLDRLCILAQPVWQGRDFVEFLFSLMRKGCQETKIAVHGEGAGIKPESLGSARAFVAPCTGLPSCTFPMVSWKALHFSSGLLKRHLPLAWASHLSVAKELCFEFFCLPP